MKLYAYQKSNKDFTFKESIKNNTAINFLKLKQNILQYKLNIIFVENRPTQRVKSLTYTLVNELFEYNDYFDQRTDSLCRINDQLGEYKDWEFLYDDDRYIVIDGVPDLLKGSEVDIIWQANTISAIASKLNGVVTVMIYSNELSKFELILFDQYFKEINYQHLNIHIHEKDNFVEFI